MITTNPRLAAVDVESASKALTSLLDQDISPADIAAIGTDSKLCEAVATCIKARRMFSSPAEQMERLLQLNESVWHDRSLNLTALARLGGPPDCPVADEKSLPCVVLLFEAQTWFHTLKRNWEACCFVHGADKVFTDPDIVFTLQGFQQRPGAQPRPRGLRWAIVDLGRRHQKISVDAAQAQISLNGWVELGQELPLLAALHPRWASLLDGVALPALYAPDIEIAPKGKGDFTHCLTLDFQDKGTQFLALDRQEVFSGIGAGYIY